MSASARANAAGNGQIARREGTQAFGRMAAIALDVEHVVDEVIGRGHEAEAKKCRHGLGDGAGNQVMRECEWRQKQNVFGPLVHPNGLDQSARGGALIQKGPGDGNVPEAEREAQAQGGVGQHGLARPGQKGMSARELPM